MWHGKQAGKQAASDQYRAYNTQNKNSLINVYIMRYCLKSIKIFLTSQGRISCVCVHTYKNYFKNFIIFFSSYIQKQLNVRARFSTQYLCMINFHAFQSSVIFWYILTHTHAYTYEICWEQEDKIQVPTFKQTLFSRIKPDLQIICYKYNHIMTYLEFDSIIIERIYTRKFKHIYHIENPQPK